MAENTTPSPERPHIVVVGKRNSGKSSLVNALTGQAASLVSDVPGTTTDPVRKAIEIPEAGPCLLIDTAGFDDDASGLGGKRIKATEAALDSADIVIFIFTDGDSCEREWFRKISLRDIPVIPTVNVMLKGCGNHASGKPTPAEEITGQPPVIVNAATGEGRERLFGAIRDIRSKESRRSVTGDLAREGDLVMLVMPQDSGAPEGRLILPQSRTIRELLEKKCTVVCCTAEGMEDALRRTAAAPHLIITDSQAFDTAWRLKPEGSLITSFSILFAALKGDMRTFLKGAEALDGLTEKSRILIAEACTHAPASEDIGRVKIPEMLRRRFGESISIDIVSGKDFPEDLTGYDLIIHCGACMFNRRLVISRIRAAAAQNVPITNYGMTMAWAGGILGKVALPDEAGRPAPGKED